MHSGEMWYWVYCIHSPAGHGGSSRWPGVRMPAPRRKEGKLREGRLEGKATGLGQQLLHRRLWVLGAGWGESCRESLEFCLAPLLNKPHRDFSTQSESSWHVETRERRIQDQLSHDCCAWAVLSRLQLFFTGYS